jgi:hypothetical protein
MHNDVPNAQRVIERSRPADLVLRPAYMEAGNAPGKAGYQG